MLFTDKGVVMKKKKWSEDEIKIAKEMLLNGEKFSDIIEKLKLNDVDFNRDFKNNSELFSDIFYRNNND